MINTARILKKKRGKLGIIKILGYLAQLKDR